MSDRLVDAFQFHGRLSRGGQRRIQYKLLAIAAVGWLAPLFLLIGGTPRVMALAPAMLLPVVAIGFAAADVRRFHDVGLHAHREWLIIGLGAVSVAGPWVLVALIPNLPALVVQILIAFSIAIVLAGLFTGRGRPEWGPGDPGPNEFGSPPPR